MSSIGRKKLGIIATIVLLVTAAGAAASSGEQMFRIEFTVYDNHTFTYLEADTVEGSEYLPYDESPESELYFFEFYDEEDVSLHREEVYVYFPEHQPLAQPGEPTMSSTYVQLPVVEEAEELRIMHQGNELASIDLVDDICMQTLTDECNQFCESHGMSSGCSNQDNTGQSNTGQAETRGQQGEDTNEGVDLTDPLVIILVAIILIVLILGIYFYRKQGDNVNQRIANANRGAGFQ